MKQWAFEVTLPKAPSAEYTTFPSEFVPTPGLQLAIHAKQHPGLFKDRAFGNRLLLS
jgi:hypothetical protein